MPLSPFALLDRHFAPAPDHRRAAWLADWTYAHRGLHGPGVPENSQAAFAAAIAKGMGIELDVHRAADGRPVVFHDWSLDRMTGDTGPLAARSSAQLAAIQLTGSDQTIPDLRGVLDLVAGRTALLVEIKARRETRIAPLCMAVRRELEGYRGPHAVISFDPRVIRWFARHAPLTPRGLSYTEGGDQTLLARLRRRLALWSARPDFLDCDIRDLPSRFAAAQRRRGLKIVAWTITNAEQRDLAMAQADALIAEGAGAG